MSRSPLTLPLLLCALSVCVAQAQSPPNPHMDRSIVTGSCRACHSGHGASDSPMMDMPQAESCFACHGTEAAAQAMHLRGLLAFDAAPQNMAAVFDDVFSHALDRGAYSRHEPGVVTCSSCHSPHRGTTGSRTNQPLGMKKPSTRDPNRFEYQLCFQCHGNQGSLGSDLSDISRLVSPSNRSYHPIETTAIEGSGSVIPGLAGREINCTDCHGSDNPSGPRGPHGSSIQYMLRENYVTVDGSDESAQVYALCYGCHRRQTIILSTAFSGHKTHISDYRTSCATCHSAHGSVGNRALIRFGEETTIGNVGPAMRSGRLAFVSDVPGTGACYLNCHGVDHDPKAYGFMKGFYEVQGRIGGSGMRGVSQGAQPNDSRRKD